MSFTESERAFLKSASVSIIVPQNTQQSLAQTIQDEEGEITLQDIRQRDLLFFDERLTVFVVLCVPQCPEDELKSYLSRLELRVEAWATSSTQTSERSPASTGPARDLVFTDVVKHNEDPIVLVSQGDDDEKLYLNLVWETLIVLNRPRVRMQDGYATFIPTALVAPLEESSSTNVYLEPFQPQIGNLFASLKGTRGFENDIPYLPISRLDPVLPAQPKDDHTFHIQSTASQSIPTHLAFATRLRCTKPHTADTSSSLIASLDLELIPFIDVEGHIHKADLVLQRGNVHSYTTDMLPIDCQSRDCITFLYKLYQMIETGQHYTSSPTDTLVIAIELKLILSEYCQPIIQMEWTTIIDFMQTANSSSSIMGSTKQSESISSVSQDARLQYQPQFVTAALQPSPSAVGAKMITISFAAPLGSVRVGVPFVWQILVVNQTAKAVKLAIIPLPRVQKSTSQVQQYAKRHATRSSIASINTNDKHTPEQSDVAQAVVDENIVYALQHSGAVPPETDLMSLTPELRVGPLGPGQCYEGEIKMIAFKPGAFVLDAIRVVDLVKEIEQGYASPGVVIDIRDLPDVIVEGEDLNNENG